MFNKLKDQAMKMGESFAANMDEQIAAVHSFVESQGFNLDDVIIGVVQTETEDGGVKGFAASMLANSALITSKDWVAVLSKNTNELTLLGIEDGKVDQVFKLGTNFHLKISSDMKNMLKDELTSMIGFGGKKSAFGGKRAERDQYGRTTVKISGEDGEVEILVGKMNDTAFSAYYFNNEALFTWFDNNK